MNKSIVLYLDKVYRGSTTVFHSSCSEGYGRGIKILKVLDHAPKRDTTHIYSSDFYWRILPNVSQGSFFQEQISRPVSKMAWSCRVPSFPISPDCHWQKLLKVWSAWWLITSPGCARWAKTPWKWRESMLQVIVTTANCHEPGLQIHSWIWIVH
jgi:hypothetical protein